MMNSRALAIAHKPRYCASGPVDCRASRSAALLQFDAEVPPVVLADTLGIHRSTARRWVQIAGGDWSRYAAERARERAVTERRTP